MRGVSLGEQQDQAKAFVEQAWKAETPPGSGEVENAKERKLKFVEEGSQGEKSKLEPRDVQQSKLDTHHVQQKTSWTSMISKKSR